MTTHFPIAQAHIPDELVDFGVGQPGFDLLPLDLVRKASAHALAGEENAFLNYGYEQGDTLLRRAMGHFLSEEYRSEVDPDHLFITNGASQALDLLCTIFTQPGDVIFAEEPSYFLALRIFEDHGLQVRGVPMDEEGIDVEALRQMLAQQQPVFLYTIPTFQNPTGITLSAERRQQLVALAQEHQFLIVADEVYQLLHYTEAPPLPMAHYLDTGSVISVGSFSKILAPGLRLGWIQAAPQLVQRFAGCGLVDSGGGLNPYTSVMVRSMLTEGWQQEYVGMLRAAYANRITVMDVALGEHLANRVGYRRPTGGFFFWLTFSEDVDTAQLLPAARKQGVGFQPGVKFSSQQGLGNQCRLSFAFYPQEKLVEGIERLAKVLSQAT